ncbi:ABC transporter ATP-binding protein [Brevundimonas sp.]|uniref:ABC transporter ATP-binding protein n=1 Tax=Brevundimonas sp. TaxID=1871086 RepID=UPI0035B47CCC
MSGPALELIGARAALGRRTVLDGIDLSVAAGEVAVLAGPNGAGKTSLMRAALGLIPLTGGEARLGGQAVSSLSPGDRARRAAWLPQQRRLAWNMPAVEVAALGAPFLSGAEAVARARRWLERLEAGHLADRGVAEMSGGERARVMLTRLLVTEAPLLVLDEPLTDLDPDAQLLVLELLRERAQAGAAVLASLHDLGLAARGGDRVAVMAKGRMAAVGASMEALRPQVLSEVFGLTGAWVETRSGPALSVERAVRA